MEDAKKSYAALEHELVEVRAERDMMRTAILNFCHESRWASEYWKQQAHIKALFNIAFAYETEKENQ